MNEKIIKSLFLEGAVKECAVELEKDNSVDAFSTACGSLILNETEEVQVQIIVTRKREDFLGDFDIVGHRTLSAKT